MHCYEVRGSHLQKSKSNMHPLCAHYRFMTLVKRKGGGCLLTCLTFKFRRHRCQVLCSTFCPMSGREGWVCAFFNTLFGASLAESYFGCMRAHKNSSPTVQRVLIVILWCIVHQSESSVGSAACVYVIQNNNSVCVGGGGQTLLH